MTTSAAGSSANRTTAPTKRRTVPLLLQLPDLRVETVEEQPTLAMPAVAVSQSRKEPASAKPTVPAPENAADPVPKPPVKRRIIHQAHQRLRPVIRRSRALKALKKAATSSWAHKAAIAGGGVALILAAYFVLNGFRFNSGVPETADTTKQQSGDSAANVNGKEAWEDARWADASEAPRWGQGGPHKTPAMKKPAPRANKPVAPPAPVNSKKLQGNTKPKPGAAAKPKTPTARKAAPPSRDIDITPRMPTPPAPRGEMYIERHETSVDNPHVRGGVDSLPSPGSQHRMDEWCPPGMPSPQDDAHWNSRRSRGQITPAADANRYQGRPIYDRNHDGYRNQNGYRGYSPQNDRMPLEASNPHDYGALPAPPSNQRPGTARLTGGITEYR